MRFYNQKITAIDYFHQVRKRGVSSGLAPFLKLIEREDTSVRNTTVLELGVGPGIEFQEMINLGYLVDGMDISLPMNRELVKVLDKETNKEWAKTGTLSVASLQDFKPRKDYYDGIWSQATFLHLELPEVISMINKYAQALKHEGLFHFDFKVGNELEVTLDRKGRPFIYFTKESFLKNVVPYLKGVEIFSLEIPDAKDALGRANVQWMTIILKRI